MINIFYLTILKFSFEITFSIFLIGDGKSIRSIKIIAINNTTNANIILINIPKIPFGFPIVVFFFKLHILLNIFKIRHICGFSIKNYEFK